MVRKVRDERKAEMHARKEKRRRDQLLTLPSGLMFGDGVGSLEEGENQPQATGATPTLVHFAEDANKDQNGTKETPAAENGRRTRLRSSSLGAAAGEKSSATAAPSAKAPNVKMTGAPGLLKSALKKVSQVANALTLANAPTAATQQQQAQNVHTPRVKLGPNDQIVADQATLTVQASHENRISESEFTRKTGDKMMINSQTYGNRSKPTKWTRQAVSYTHLTLPTNREV